jgi:hypothetical protein
VRFIPDQKQLLLQGILRQQHFIVAKSPSFAYFTTRRSRKEILNQTLLLGHHNVTLGEIKTRDCLWSDTQTLNKMLHTRAVPEGKAFVAGLNRAPETPDLRQPHLKFFGPQFGRKPGARLAGNQNNL